MSSEAGEGSSSSTAPKKELMEAQAKAENLLAQGKRNLICREIPLAVQQFQDACQILSKEFGEMARECAEAYLSYGGALLDLSRMEQDVLGNALDGVDVDAEEEEGTSNKEQFETTEKMDEEERMELRLKVVNAMSEEEIRNQALLATGQTTKDESKSEDASLAGGAKAEETDDTMTADQEKEEEMETGDEEIVVEEGSGSCEKPSSIEKKVAEIDIEEAADEVDGGEDAGDDPKDKKVEEGENEGEEEGEGESQEEEEEEGEEEGGSQDEGQESEDADDVSNLQLSWEMLDLAKFIYSRDPSKESQLKAAEAYLKLGEVSLESEQYEQAVNDLESCLEIQKQHLEPCDRAIAETYYQLGLACQMDKQFSKAKDCFTSALTCLETKMEKLKVIQEQKPPKSPSQMVEPAESAEMEISQILDVLPEIRDKIKDTEEEGKSLENVKRLAIQTMSSIFSTAADSTSETGFPGTSSASPVKSTSTEPQKTMDISHLVRKKRKPEDEKQQDEDLESKKQKQESSSGDAGVNGVHEVTDSTSEAMAAT